MSNPHRVVETFDCRDRIFQGFTTQTLDRDPGISYVYSDSSMITMMYIIGLVARRNNLVSDLREDCLNNPTTTTMRQLRTRKICATLRHMYENMFFNLIFKIGGRFYGFSSRRIDLDTLCSDVE